MDTLWITLKGFVNCGSKQSNKVFLAGKTPTETETQTQTQTQTCVKENMNKDLIHGRRRSMSDVSRGFHSPKLYSELKSGDSARNIIEMIFQRASNQAASRKIKRVLRVKNSTEVVESFEKYRAKVKEVANHHQNTHPRTTVDGNELMRFYGTTICCCTERSRQVSELCRDPACRVCRIIQSNFDIDYTKENGIRLSTKTEQLTDKTVSSFGAKNERAVIVCRIIAGTVVHNREHLVVRNPSAVLPCFVIVFT